MKIRIRRRSWNEGDGGNLIWRKKCILYAFTLQFTPRTKRMLR